MTEPHEPAKTSKKAVRLMFSYDGDNVQLISEQPVEMTLPPSDPVEDFESQESFFADLKDQQNQTLYRQVMHHPGRSDIEVFSDEPGETVSRYPVDQPKGVFVVVVPDTEEGLDVTLSRGSGQAPGTGEDEASAAPSEIARFRLKK